MTDENYVGYCNGCGAEYRGATPFRSGFCEDCDIIVLSNGVTKGEMLRAAQQVASENPGKSRHEQNLLLADRIRRMRDPVVKIYRSGSNNSFALATTAGSAEEFLREAGDALANIADDFLGGEGLLREDGSIAALLPQICAVWAKLNGYKAETVHERRVLIVGEPNPEAHMKWLNAPAEATPASEPEAMAMK